MKKMDITKWVGPRILSYSAVTLFLFPVFSMWGLATYYLLPGMELVLDRKQVVDPEILELADVPRYLSHFLGWTVLVAFLLILALDIKGVRWAQNRLQWLYLVAFLGNVGVVLGLWAIGGVVLVLVTR